MILVNIKCHWTIIHYFMFEVYFVTGHSASSFLLVRYTFFLSFYFLPYSYMNYIFNITHIGNAYLIQLNSFCLWIELFDLITFNDISVPGFSFLYCVCLLYIYVSCIFLQSSFTKSILSAPLFQLMHWFLLFFSKYLISDLSKI